MWSLLSWAQQFFETVVYVVAFCAPLSLWIWEHCWKFLSSRSRIRPLKSQLIWGSTALLGMKDDEQTVSLSPAGLGCRYHSAKLWVLLDKSVVQRLWKIKTLLCWWKLLWVGCGANSSPRLLNSQGYLGIIFSHGLNVRML